MSALREKLRCRWVNLDNPTYVEYHDREWGRPVHDDRLLFELLILEGAQAGLSWETVLMKRQTYRKAFAGFDARKIAKFTAADQARLMKDPGIIRNRLKIKSAIQNARAFLEIQKEFGSFDRFIWQFVQTPSRKGPIKNLPKVGASLPSKTPESDAMSKALKRRGFNFVGSTICYAFMQATGMVDDHFENCFRAAKPSRASKRS